MASKKPLPIFDSLTHPTLSGKWPGRSVDAGFERLHAELSRNGFSGACAVGLHGVEGHDNARFMEACRTFPELYPVAGFSLDRRTSPSRQCKAISELGFRAIKIHPRSAGTWPSEGALSEIFLAAAEWNLTVFICTFHFGRLEQLPAADPFYPLAAALKSAPQTKVVLVHGGGPELLRYSELVRSSPQLLLDVSFTAMRYAGSSIDADVRFVFRNLSKRVCIGTDHPEYDHVSLRRRFDELCEGLPEETKADIAERNLKVFLGIRS